jgi:midasin
MLDGVGMLGNSSLPEAEVERLRSRGADELLRLCPVPQRAHLRPVLQLAAGAKARPFGRSPAPHRPRTWTFGADPFFVPCGPLAADRADQGATPETAADAFAFDAPTTATNVRRLLRAMQLKKPVLLEGSPGVGKTSLVAALAAAAGHELTRINLSDQTDLADLMGSDVPVPDDDADDGDGGGDGDDDDFGGDGSMGDSSGDGPKRRKGKGGARFAWRDGAFLRALKLGHWVLLDELNLAPQAVLEGLNACLDHRAEVFIPELGRTFKCPPTFRVFAAQNPLGQVSLFFC